MAGVQAGRAKRLETCDLLFGAGWVSHLGALDLATSQGTADALHGAAVACMGASAGMAWQSGHRWRAAVFGALSMGEAVLGPPLLTPHSALHTTTARILVGLWVAAVLVAILRRPRRPAAASPIAG